MPDLSSAESAGGMVVTIKGDNSPLKAMIAQTKQEMQALTTNASVIAIKLDTVAADRQFKEFSSNFTKANAFEVKLSTNAHERFHEVVEEAKTAQKQIQQLYELKDATAGAYGVAGGASKKGTVYGTGFMSWSEKDEDNKKRFLQAMGELEATGKKIVPKNAFGEALTDKEIVSLHRSKAKAAKAAEDAGKEVADAFDKGLGGKGGHGDISRKNLFSRRGLETLGVGGSATAAFAILEGIGLVGEGIGAANIASHPERILRDMQGIGAPSLAMTDKSSGVLAQVIASSRAQEKIVSAIEGIPILGSFAKIGGELMDTHGNIADTEASATRGIQTGRWLYSNDIQQRLGAATAKGDQVKAFDVSQEEKFASLRAAADTSGTERKISEEAGSFKRVEAFAGDSDATLRERALSAHPEWKAELDHAAEAKRQLDVQSNISAEQHNQLQRVVNAARGSIVGSGQAAEIRGQATNLLASRAPGSILAATIKSQQAGLSQFDTETESQQAGNPLHRAEIGVSRGKERAAQEAENARQVQEIMRADGMQEQSIVAKGNAAVLQANQQGYAAKLVMLKDAQRQELDAVKAHAPELIKATEDSQAKVLKAAEIENNRMVSNGVLTSIGSIGSSILSGQGRGLQGAQFAQKFQQQIQLAAIENPVQRALTAAGFRAQKWAEDRQFAYEGRSLDIGYQSTIEAERLKQKNEPLTAQVVERGAAVLQSIRSARPDKIEEARVAGVEQLKTLKHDLFDPHSGGYAAIGSSYFIPGDPLGLTNHSKDVADAESQLQKKIDEAKNEKGQGSWTLDDVKSVVTALLGLSDAIPKNLIGNGS